MTEAVGQISAGYKKLLDGNLIELASVKGNLLSVSGKEEVRTIYVTSCHPGEGKTASSVSMAYALAKEAFEKVLLVDGNLYAPRIHQIFNIEMTPGLSEMLVSASGETSPVRTTEYENLSVMPMGSEYPNLFDAFTSKKLIDIIDVLKEKNEYVIFDGYSVLGASDASVVARFFDGIVLVVECEKTKWEVVQLAREKMEKAGGNILGVILNRRKYYIPKVLYGNE